MLLIKLGVVWKMWISTGFFYHFSPLEGSNSFFADESLYMDMLAGGVVLTYFIGRKDGQERYKARQLP